MMPITKTMVKDVECLHESGVGLKSRTTTPAISLNSLIRASHRMRDLSLVHAGYLFSKSGHLLVKTDKNQLKNPNSSLQEVKDGG